LGGYDSQGCVRQIFGLIAEIGAKIEEVILDPPQHGIGIAGGV
jgi:hypothetical protein